MNYIDVEFVNHVWCKLQCSETYIDYELRDIFSFKVPNAYFMTSYRNKLWDGYIRLYNLDNKLFYHGLLNSLEKYCKRNSIQLNYKGYPVLKFEINTDNLYHFIKNLNLPFTIYKYQLTSFIKCIQSNRRLILSPTGSGKSLIIYLLVRWYLEQNHNNKILIVVPTINLVSQMYTDFMEYGFQSEKYCFKIYGGIDNHDMHTKNVHISTWQSIYNNDISFFDSYSCVIMDEAHHCKAKSLTGILEKLINTPYRFGFTGTLDEMESNKMLVQGLLGPIYNASTTKKLIDSGRLANIQINNIIIKYKLDQEINKKFKTYNDEIEFISNCNKRTKFIKNLVENIFGNKLILFTRITHGKALYDEITKNNIEMDYNNETNLSKKSSQIFFIYGDTDKEEREKIRKKMETMDNAILIASYGTFSTGVNIKKLHHIIFASPYKSKIKVLQSIGRGLRIHESKTKVSIYDIVDDISEYMNKRNYLLKHFIKRIDYYIKESFNFKNRDIHINLTKDDV